MQVFYHTEHGTLKDLIHNETVQLDPEMLTAILKDVTMGLKYLHGHSPPRLEQDLTPLSVLLTGDYVAQLAHHDMLMQAVCTHLPIGHDPTLLHPLRDSSSIICISCTFPCCALPWNCCAMQHFKWCLQTCLCMKSSYIERNDNNSLNQLI